MGKSKKIYRRKAKSLMELHRIKGVDIARDLALSAVTVSIVVTGRGKSRRVQSAIHKALIERGEKIDYNDLWPDDDRAA